MINTNTPNNSYNLSIRFRSDGFSLSVADENHTPISSRTISTDLFSKTEDALLEMFSKETELSIKYNSVRLICETENYTVVPTAIFKPEYAKDLLTFHHHHINPEDTVLYNEIMAWNAVIVFAIPNAFNSILKMLPEIEMEHHVYSFINNFVPLQKGSGIYVWIRSNKLDAVVLDKGYIQLINSYEFSTKEDFLYHILNLYQQLSLDTEQCELLICNSVKSPDLIELTRKYLNCKTEL